MKLSTRSFRLFLRTYAPDANPECVCEKTGLGNAAAIFAAVAALAAANEVATFVVI